MAENVKKQKLSKKLKHVKLVDDVLRFIATKIYDRVGKHDYDKIMALRNGKEVNSKLHHQQRHHWLSASSKVKDVNVIDLVESIADNIASAILESDQHELATFTSSPNVKESTLDDILLNTARLFGKASYSIVAHPEVFQD